MATTTNSDSNCQESNNTHADNATANAANITCGKGGKTGNPLEALWSEYNSQAALNFCAVHSNFVSRFGS